MATKAQFQEVTKLAYNNLEARRAELAEMKSGFPPSAYAVIGEISLKLNTVFTGGNRMTVRDTYKLNGKVIKKEALIKILEN